MPRSALPVVAMILSLALPCAATGQQEPSARLRGTVTDASTGLRLHGVRVVVGATGRFVVTDSVGAFEIAAIPSGVIRFIFSAKGFPTAQVSLALAPGEIMTQSFEMDSSAAAIAADTGRGRPAAQLLPTEEIRAPEARGVRFADFERRMKSGRGQYVTREKIEEAGYSVLPDAMRGLRGVAVDCTGGRACHIRMARAPGRCSPQYIVDGREDNWFGPYVAIRDIEGIEVYTGASDVPGEFAGSSSACGVIVIWTKSGPAPKRP